MIRGLAQGRAFSQKEHGQGCPILRRKITRSAKVLDCEIEICLIFSTIEINCQYAGQGNKVPAEDGVVNAGEDGT